VLIARAPALLLGAAQLERDGGRCAGHDPPLGADHDCHEPNGYRAQERATQGAHHQGGICKHSEAITAESHSGAEDSRGEEDERGVSGERLLPMRI